MKYNNIKKEIGGKFMPFRIGWPASQPTPSGPQGGEGFLGNLINTVSRLFSTHVKKEEKVVQNTQVTRVARNSIPPSTPLQPSQHPRPQSATTLQSRTPSSNVDSSQGAALTTAQGPDAEVHANNVNACITVATAKQSDSALSTHGEREFIGCMNAIEEVIKTADLNDPKQCEFVNGLVQLVQKGFNVHSGGVGSLHHNADWKDEWNHLGKVVKFEKDKPENAQVKEQVFKMLAFYKENAEAHFSEARHLGSREVAAAQVAATIGQLVQDFTHNDEFPPEIRNSLFSQMRIHGLVNDTITFKDMNAIKNKMRGNPLLAEVKNKSLKLDIVNGLKAENNKTEMVALIKEELTRQNVSGDLDTLALKIYDNFLKKVDEMKFLSDKTGSRGRAPLGGAPAWTEELGATLAGHPGASKSIAIAPHRANDHLSDKHAREALGDQPEIAAFDHAVHGDENMFKRGASPKTVLRLGKGLDTQFVNLLNPAKLFAEAAKEVVPQWSEPSPLFVEGYKKIVGNIDVTFNGATRQKMPLQEFADMKSVASIMRKNNLRTICSISGTTVDIILAKITTMGNTEVQKLMQPLLDHLEGKQPDPLGTPGTEEGKKFKQWFTSISLFMQAGNYHTAAEVLGGLFIAGRGLTCSDEENKDIGRTYQLFEKLMAEFSQTPEKFFDVTPEDAAKIKGHEKEFRKDLAIAEKTRITTHHEV